MNILKQLMELYDSSQKTYDPTDVMSKLKAAEFKKDARSNTRGFALEDDKGALVRIFVRADQADDFEQALSSYLNDNMDGEMEIAELLFNIKNEFEIVDIIWGEGSIPEDEEAADNTLDSEPVDGDVEGPDGAFPDGENPDDPKSGMAATGDVPGPGGTTDTDSQALSALDKIIDMMKADAEARTKEAEARKAEAAVNAGRVAAQAASARAKAEEEIMDMENYNKRQKEEKRLRDIRAKLLKYRHETQTESTNPISFIQFMLVEDDCSAMYPDATPEEEEVLDMEDHLQDEQEKKKREATREKLIRYRHNKKKGQIKESLFDTTYADATPEEEEILDMEAAEREEAERRKREATRDKLIRYRHKQKKQQSGKLPEPDPIDQQIKKDDDFIDLSHRVQY
jgi:hypothetical protein